VTTALDETQDPARRSWLPVADCHPDFPVQNLPFGIFYDREPRRGGVAIGDHILDLTALADGGLLEGVGHCARRSWSALYRQAIGSRRCVAIFQYVVGLMCASPRVIWQMS
jgi:Fumarylacetoacetase N-terminal